MAIVVLNIEYGTIFLNKFMKQQKNIKNFVFLGWNILFFCIAVTYFFFIIADFYSSVEPRQMFLNIGYISVGSGEIFLGFYVEHEIKSKYYIITISISSILAILIININFHFISTNFFALFLWILFLILLINYINRFISKTEHRWKYNIYGFIASASIFFIGWASISDFGLELLGIGFLTRLIGDIFVIIGTSSITLSILGLPRLSEINWIEKIDSLYVMHNSGAAIYSYPFKKEKKLEGDTFYSRSQVIAGGLTSITQLISTLIQREEKLEIVDHGDKKIIFDYGDYIINALIVDELVNIMKIKLKNLTKDIETLYQKSLASFYGNISIFPLLKTIIQQHFTT